jgi:hypothetical protein
MLTNTSWKTAILGAILAIVVAVAPIIQTGAVDWKAVGMAALIALLGYFTKDKNVTGGTVDNGERPK